MANSKTVILKIKRQQTPESKPYWEEFELQYRSGMNVTSALMDIAAKPVTRQGKPTTPVTYDSNCLEEICGSCAMLINGQAKMACSALIAQLKQPITLEPFTKFPIVRDLAVDRSVLFENLKQVKAWVPVDGTYDLGSGPRQSAEMQEEAYPLSQLHLVLLLHGGLPAVQREDGLRGRSHHRAGPALQLPSHRQSA